MRRYGFDFERSRDFKGAVDLTVDLAAGFRDVAMLHVSFSRSAPQLGLDQPVLEPRAEVVAPNHIQEDVPGGVPLKMWTRGVPVEDVARRQSLRR